MSEQALALVVEDDFDASVIFAKALEVLGFKTEVIAAGDKALVWLKANVPDIIILDLHLPEVLGTSIIRTIRADERLSETLVILATADPRSADLVQDMADLVLIKPTTYSQVRDLAGRLTANRRKKLEPAAEAAPPAGAQVEIKTEIKTEAPPAEPAQPTEAAAPTETAASLPAAENVVTAPEEKAKPAEQKEPGPTA